MSPRTWIQISFLIAQMIFKFLYRCVDLRTVSYEVPPQEMLSRDSVTVSVDAVCFYKISNPLAAVCNVGNYTHSTNLLVATSLRNVLGINYFHTILQYNMNYKALQF